MAPVVRSVILSGLAAALPLIAVTWQPPVEPRRIERLANGAAGQGQGVLTWIDWGVAGPAHERRAEWIAEEQEAFQRWLASPEFLARMARLAQHGRQREQHLIRREIDRWWRAYDSEARVTRYARRGGLLRDEVALPVWARGIPQEYREVVQVLLFDDRDPVQRQWAETIGRVGDRFTIAMVTGWRSGRDRDDHWRARPGVFQQFAAVASDDLATHYQVSAYPARIRFTGHSMVVEQGIAP